jgi:hypothetical protein
MFTKSVKVYFFKYFIRSKKPEKKIDVQGKGNFTAKKEK